jgi:hypothetical protein
MVHVGLHSVGTNHKKFGRKKKKNKNILCRVSKVDTWQSALCRVSAHITLGKVCFVECLAGTLGKVFFKIIKNTLPSACQRALGKDVFAEC